MRENDGKVRNSLHILAAGYVDPHFKKKVKELPGPWKQKHPKRKNPPPRKKQQQGSGRPWKVIRCQLRITGTGGGKRREGRVPQIALRKSGKPSRGNGLWNSKKGYGK